MLRYIIALSLFFFVSCKDQEEKKEQKQILKTYELPVPVDTKTKTIELQKRQTYKVDGIYASNEFKGARLNSFYKSNDSLIAKITPEIYPINNSPWYAFKIWSDDDKTQNVFLKYENGTHRYAPKVSSDFKRWSDLDTTKMTVIDSVTVKLELDLKKEPMFVAAQPVQNSDMINEWMAVKAKLPNVEMVKIGERFFTSVGFEPLPESFWSNSMFVKPEDRDVVCHASAWSIDYKDDLRIKMCIQINEEDFITVHHELGHNFYQRAYNQLNYRESHSTNSNISIS